MKNIIGPLALRSTVQNGKNDDDMNDNNAGNLTFIEILVFLCRVRP
jgi:hypothetical protein